VDTGSERSPSDRLEIRELRDRIDAELERLPAAYRAPLILCDLEGQTQEQAAAQLGCPVGTVKSRLARGRERLRSGLARRGVAPTAGLLAATFAAESAHAVPVELLSTTLGAATRVAAGQAIAAGASSAGAASFTKGVLRSMLLAKISIAAAALTAAALATTGLRGLILPATPPQEPKPAAAPPSQKPAPEPFRTPPERGVERFQLANGLKVFLRPIKGSESTALVVVYGIGSDHDPKGRSGLAHAIEHLYITSAAGDEKTRPAEELMRRYPAGANGQTGDRYTMFAAIFPAGELDRELADAAARMKELKLTAADLDRERPRLLGEIANMFANFPALAALNNARELARPMPVGGRHGGLPEVLGSLRIEEVRARLDRHYKPRNATLALAGDFDPAAARKAIEAHFAAMPGGEPVPPPLEPGAPRKETLTIRPKAGQAPDPEDQPTACLAYRAPAPDSELYPALLVLVARLWTEAGRLGTDGPTGSPVFFTPLDDGSVVAIQTAVNPGEPPAKAYERIEQYVARMVEPKLDTDEAENVQQQLGMLLGLGDIPDSLLNRNPYGVAFSIARRDQLGLDPARLDQALKALTDQDLKRAAAAIFDPNRHSGAIAGVAEPRP
jgi:zinc protease